MEKKEEDNLLPVIRKIEEDNYFRMMNKPPLPELSVPVFPSQNQNLENSESIVDISENNSLGKSPDVSDYTIEKRNE